MARRPWLVVSLVLLAAGWAASSPAKETIPDRSAIPFEDLPPEEQERLIDAAPAPSAAAAAFAARRAAAGAQVVTYAAYQVAVREVHIDGRCGHYGVKRNAVLVRDDRHLVRADFICDIAVRRDAIRANKTFLDFAGAHKMTQGIIRDQRHRHAGLRQFPRG